MLVPPSTGNKAAGKPGSFPQRLGWFVQELVSDLLIPYNSCAAARASFRLTGWSREMPSDAPHRTVQTWHEVFTHVWDSAWETLLHAKSWEETWESPAGVTPRLLERVWLILEATRLCWENSLTLKTAGKNRKGELCPRLEQLWLAASFPLFLPASL